MAQNILQYKQRWPSLCGDAGEKEEEGIFLSLLSLPEDGCFYRRCLPMRSFYSEFNGE